MGHAWAARSRLGPKDILKAGIIVVGVSQERSPIELALNLPDLSLSSVRRVEDLSTLLLLVASRSGIGLVRSGEAEHLSFDDVLLRPLAPRAPHLRTYLLTSKENRSPPAALMLQMVEGNAASGTLRR